MTRFLQRLRFTRLALPVFAGGLLMLAGCAGDGSGEGPGADPDDIYEPEYAFGTSAALRVADDCDDLLTRLQRDALARLEQEVQQLLDWYVHDRSGSEGGLRGGRAGEEAAFDGDASAPPMGPGGGDDDDASPDDFSETNNQVSGVDEADLVKTDGERIFVVSGQRFQVVDSWPPAETALTASVPIDGYATEMLIQGDRAVIFSHTGDPREGEEPCAGREAYWYPCGWGWGFTKMTVVDVLPEGPEVVRELWVEGSYRTARRHAGEVRAVFNDHYNLPWYDGTIPYVYDYLWPEEAGDRFDEEGGRFREPSSEEMRRRIFEWRADAIAAIRARSLDDWLPTALEGNADAGLTALPVDCTGFHLPEPGLAEWGVMQIVGFDLAAADSPVSRTGVWGWAGEVYANADVMIIAQNDWSVWWRRRHEPGEWVSDRTFLHQFEIGESGATNYEASGTVPGVIVDQFSLDQRDGVVRVTTTETAWTWSTRRRWQPPRITNRLYTMEPRDGVLRGMDRTGHLGEPDERIFSTRFIGDTAYVVTFRQVDPLYAIDVSNPEDIVVLGELKIPGFSTYMHPLGEAKDHLLTIGQDANPRTGEIRGLALQIFDVSDPTDPKQVHKHVFEDRWGYSEALWEHKAFTYFDHLEMLAFPYVAWGNDWNDYRSSLELFDVSIEGGIVPRGSIDHTALLDPLCGDRAFDWECRYYGMPIRRGVFIEDYIYSISYGGIRVHDTRDLDAGEVASFGFPQD